MHHATKPYDDSRQRKSRNANAFQPPRAAQPSEKANYVAKNEFSRHNSPRQNFARQNEGRDRRGAGSWSSGDQLCRQKRDFATKCDATKLPATKFLAQRNVAPRNPQLALGAIPLLNPEPLVPTARWPSMARENLQTSTTRPPAPYSGNCSNLYS
jgi:hypothetical protein